MVEEQVDLNLISTEQLAEEAAKLREAKRIKKESEDVLKKNEVKLAKEKELLDKLHKQELGIKDTTSRGALPKGYDKRIEKKLNTSVDKAVGEKISPDSGLVSEYGAPTNKKYILDEMEEQQKEIEENLKKDAEKLDKEKEEQLKLHKQELGIKDITTSPRGALPKGYDKRIEKKLNTSVDKAVGEKITAENGLISKHGAPIKKKDPFKDMQEKAKRDRKTTKTV